MFFHTIDGDMIPVSRIQRIRDSGFNRPDNQWPVELTDGEEVVIGLSAKAKLDALPVATFVAASGTQVLRVDEGKLFSYAVIGWVVPQEGNPMPVTIDGVNDGSDPEIYLNVLLPDGNVYRPESPVYSMEEFRRENNVYDAVFQLDVETTPGLADLIESRKIDA